MELLTGAGHPSKRLKGELGQHYKDTVTGDVWECISANEHSRIHHQLMGGYIWKKMATGNHIEACNVAGGSAPTEVVILKETVLTADQSEAPILDQLSAFPEVGGTCSVTYNGTAYDCPVISAPMNGMAAVALGNTEAMELGAGNSDAPFAVVLFPYATELGEVVMYGACVPMDGATSITLSIVQTEGANDESGENAIFTAHVTINNNDANSIDISDCDKTYLDFCRAWLAEKPIRVIGTRPGIEAGSNLYSDEKLIGHVTVGAVADGILLLKMEMPNGILTTGTHHVTIQPNDEGTGVEFVNFVTQ